MSSDYYASIAGEIADDGAKTEAAFLEWLDAYTRRPATGTYHDDLRAAFEAGADRGYAPDVLRRVARLVIGGNAPWLADELTDLAGRLEREMNGVSTQEAAAEARCFWVIAVSPDGRADPESGPDGPFTLDEAVRRARPEPDPLSGWRELILAVRPEGMHAP